MEILLAWWSSCLVIFVPLIIFFFSNFRRRRNTPSQTQLIVDSPSSPSDSSSQQPLPSGEYEVFLSFRGPDTRNNIADFLYTYLHRSRIRTFRDEEELRKGEEIAPGLIQAIHQSKIYIPIFSRTYASSKWCLKELAQMVDCRNQDRGHVFFPIFYLVDPRDVRHQTGSYQEAFRLHEMKHDRKTVQEWRDALKVVGEMKGWHISDSNWQGSIVDQVFEKVLSLLNKNYTLVTDELVGIVHHVEKVVKLLAEEDSDAVKVVGIHGMGGIGKTTIATAVYNEMSTHFGRCSFLEDVRETLQQHEGVVALQNKLISSITRANSSVTNASEGVRVIKDRISRHKVLIVLDDVDEKFESEKILGRYENFSAGSRFIITTRNKKLLTSIQGCELYEPEEMSARHSLQLFSKHAFRMDRPPKNYESLSRQIVLVAAGLPLTLKVVGSLLFGEDKSIWEDTFMQLQEIPPTEVVGRLKLSYNALTYQEQRIFLDIACFFIGENREMASYMWKDCKFYPVSGINVLILRSLIKIGPKNEFKMHDQLRDLGRVIVREENFENPWKRSRVWSHDDALDILERKKGTDSVEALRLAKGNSIYQLTNEQFEKLPELRYLDINGVTITGDFHALLSNLRWLRLSPLKGGRSPIANFPPMKLVILDLSGSYIPDSWGGWTNIKMAQNLKVLNLYTCGGLTKVPDLSEYKNLEQLNLEKCRGIVDQDLDIGTLKNLKVVKLGFTRITRLIGNIGMLPNLEEIDAWGCRNLKEVAPDIGESTSLKILRLCSEVKLNLPELPLSLKELSLSSQIPNLSSLKELVELRFDNCEEGFEIAGDYVMLSLSKLKSLELYRTNITVSQTTPGAVLPSSLNKLVLDGCPLLERLPDMENLVSLKELKLNGCPQIKEIQGLGKLKSLTSLTIDDGQSLDNLDGLGNLVSLTDLVLLRCPVIENLPTLAHLVNMKSISFWRCDRLTGIQGLNGGISKSLRELDVGVCPALQELEGLDSLEALEHLRLRGFDLLETLPSVSKMTKLKELLVRDHPRLRSIEGVECLKSLRTLSLEGCGSLERFPDLSSLKSLTVLYFDGCVNLTEVVGLAEVETLRTLSLKGCVKLTQVLGIEKLKSLAELNLPGCTLLEELPDLSGLKKSLRMVNLSGCTKLKEVVGVEKLTSLTVLNFSGCASLERLPDVSGLKGLKVMNTTGCTKLAG